MKFSNKKELVLATNIGGVEFRSINKGKTKFTLTYKCLESKNIIQILKVTKDLFVAAISSNSKEMAAIINRKI